MKFALEHIVGTYERGCPDTVEILDDQAFANPVLLLALTCSPTLRLKIPAPSITISGTALSPVFEVLGLEPG